MAFALAGFAEVVLAFAGFGDAVLVLAGFADAVLALAGFADAAFALVGFAVAALAFGFARTPPAGLPAARRGFAFGFWSILLSFVVAMFNPLAGIRASRMPP